VILFILVFVRFVRSLRRAVHNPEFQAAGSSLALLIVSGTFFYHWVEEWRWLDSLYFSVVTLATVGYGDFSPRTDVGKVFTIFYMFLGIGGLIGFATILFQMAPMHERSLPSSATTRLPDSDSAPPSSNRAPETHGD
jgi:hypothetical protein